MKKLLIVMTVFLSGCMGKTSFDCPMPENGATCKSVSDVAKKLHQQEEPKNIIYIKGA